MTGGEIILAVTAIISAGVAIFALLREWRRDRLKPTVDIATTDQLRSTVKQMAEETNRARDYRIWQLEGYVDLDRIWHREMIKIVEQLRDLLQVEMTRTAMQMPEIPIPAPPEIPAPFH